MHQEKWFGPTEQECGSFHLDFENQDDEILKQYLEYSKPGKKEALRILRDNGWNIFKQEE